MTARTTIGVLLRSEDSGGRVALVDNRVPAGTAGPPLHRHDFDEAFVVLEGEVTFQLGDDLVTRRAGEVAFAPRGVPHTFANQSGSDARHVIVITPAGFERSFDRLAARAAGIDPPATAARGWAEVTKVGPQIGGRRPAPRPAPTGDADAGRAAAGSFATRVLVRSEESGEAVALVENTVPARWAGTPLHHHAFDEAFYVIDGELTLRLGDRVVTRGPGELAFAPGGAHHAVANVSARSARYLLVCTPGGFERYFAKLAAEAAGVEPPPEVAKGYPETTVVGPPIGDRCVPPGGGVLHDVAARPTRQETDMDTEATAREILAANRYMVLGTAGADGVPWVSPVWFASEDGETFLWISKPGTRHSRNIAARREVAIVVFDSSVDSADAAALYLSAVAAELDGAERDEAVAVYSRASEAQGLGRFTTADVSGDGRWRMYRATATDRSVLGPGDERLPVG